MAHHKNQNYFHIYLSLISLVTLLLLTQVVVAQTDNSLIKGRIITPEGNAAYVTIALKNAKKTVAADIGGIFRIKAALPDTLVVTSVEYETYSIPLNENKETVDVGNIRLQFRTIELQNVEIKGRRIRSYKSDYAFSGTKTQTPVVQIPQSISSITKELIKDRMNFTLKDAVTEAAGVNAYSGYDEYTIRGFRAENARMINGLRGYNTTYTSNMLVNIERIEIVKGPVATLYGNGDPGGTINLVTKKPLEENGRELSVTAGSWDHIGANADITGPFDKKRTLLYRFNAGYDHTKSFRNLWYAKSYQLAPSFSFVPNNKLQVNADVSFSHINTLLDRGQPGFRNGSIRSTPIQLTASQPGDYLHETTLASNVLFSYSFSKNISFNSGYLNYLTWQNVNEHGIHSYITDDSVNLYKSGWDYHTTTNTFSSYFTIRAATGKAAHQIVAGHDYVASAVSLEQNYFELPDQFEEGSGIAGTFSLRRPVYLQPDEKNDQPSEYNSFANDVDATVYRTQGIYVQDQISYGRWKLLLGLREELYRSSDDDDEEEGGGEEEEEETRINQLLPRIGLVYELKPAVSLYFTYNQGFDPFEASAARQIFNEPFRPIISRLAEAGAKGNFFKNRLYASLSLYQLTVENVAVNANDISNPDLYVQQGENRSRGIETEVSGSLFPNFSVFGSYAYCVAKITKSITATQVGTLIDNAPRNASNTWMKYTFSKGLLKGFAIAAGHSQVSERNTLQEGFTLPGSTILNAGIRYSWKQIGIAANLNNITNKTYWASAYNNINKWPGAPRNVMVELNCRF